MSAWTRAEPATARPAHAAFWPVIAQIVILDAVFSLDSVITAVGMVDELPVMMAAVVVAIFAMLSASKPLTAFVSARPSLIILCLGFLLMIGLVLVVDGFGLHIPKGYVYAAIGFSVLIEALNQLGARNRRRVAESLPPRQRVADAVLRMLGGVPIGGAPMPVTDAAAPEVLRPAERHMMRGVLGLAERPVTSAMTPRTEVVWLDALASREEILARLRTSGHREYPVGRGTIDDVEGVVRKEDVVSLCLESGPFDLRKVQREPPSVPESMSVLDALNFFKATAAGLALAVDEYGNLSGVVTATDMLEAIAGDLAGPAEEPDVKVLADGSLSIDGTMPAYDLQERLALSRLPEGATTRRPACCSRSSSVFHQKVTERSGRVGALRWRVPMARASSASLHGAAPRVAN
jgi:CBS domain containing-hemolysin-like protein